MSYSHSTLSDVRSALAARLQDPGLVYWSQLELNGIITEALRAWQAFTSFSRIRASFVSSASTPFYDLSSVLTSGTTAILGYNATDQQIVNTIQYHLLEPANAWSSSTTWNGTAMFTMSLVVGALQRRRDQFLADTGCVLTRSVVNVPSSPIGRVPLSDSIIAVRRAAWASPSAAAATTYTPLWQQDAWAGTAFSPNWPANPGKPLSYSIVEDQPLEIQLIPPPNVTSQLDLVTVNAGATLDVTEGILLGVPDNWAWVPKWGALADLLLQDGEAQDIARGNYCEQRYQEGVSFCQQAEVIYQAQIDGLPVFVDSVASFDAFNPGWQLTPGPPTAIAAAGLNLVALGPVPDSAGPYSIVMDVARNAPLPVLDTDLVQIGREDLDAVIGYAVHLAAFKEGSKSVEDTIPLYQQFQLHAARYNSRIQAVSRFFPAISAQSSKEISARPYMTPVT